MVCAVVDACLEAGCERVVAVVGYKQELVREALAEYGDKVAFTEQAEQNGTGHAVRCAMPAFEGVADETPVFVLCGDGPLIRTSTLAAILDRHTSTNASATLATAVLDDPTGYGRIKRDAVGGFVGILEQKNATEADLAIREVNPSYYCFRLGALQWGLASIEPNSATGEEYVTDIPELLLGKGETVEVIEAVPSEDVLSINTLEQLADVDRVFRARAEDG